jgi:hypothetical protein
MDQYLRDLIKVLGIGAAFASIPLLVALAGLQPPWPPAIGQVSAALVLLASLAAWEWVRASALKTRRRWIVMATLLTLSGLFAYLILYSLFVETVTGTDLRVVRGYTCTSEALAVYRNQCPELPRDALRDAEWEAPVLWTRGSITMVRIGLAATWLVFTAGLICAVGSIVAGRKLGRKKS